MCRNSRDLETPVEAGKDQLAALQAGVADIRRGDGDYCIGADGQELWFWWRVDDRD